MSSDVDFFDKRWQTFFSTCLNLTPTKKLKNKRDLTQIARPNFAHSLKAANLFSRLKPMIRGQCIYNLHHFLASNQKTLLTKLPRLALSLEFSKLGLAISLIQTLTLERGGCSAQLRKGLPVLLSPREKLLQCTALKACQFFCHQGKAAAVQCTALY